MAGEISTENEITTFFHCGKCIDEKPDNISPRDWGYLEVGFTDLGIQLWCRRHEMNVMHIDFQGAKHPAVF